MDFFFKNIKPLLVELDGIDYDEFTRHPGAFTEIRGAVADFFYLSKSLETNDALWEELEGEHEKTVENFLTDFLCLVRKMANYKYGPGTQKMEGIISEFRSFCNHYNDDLIPRMRHVVERTTDRQRDAEEAWQKSLRENESLREKLAAALKENEELAANQGVSEFAKAFDEQARKNKNTAILWLLVSIALAIGIGAILWLIFEAIDKDANFKAFLQATLAKMLLMSFLFVVFHHVVKNYNVNMHLYTLNRHRQNSIDSFLSFFKATEDSRVRDAILTQATRAIYEAGETGYVSSKGGGNMTGIDSIRIAGGGKD